jgi:GT2 family glycosyltransferase
MGFCNHKPYLSIVIVNSDGVSDTLNCLDSIYHCPPSIPFEVVLVDNLSGQPGSSPVQSRFPEVTAVSSPRKQGFSKNYNLGMRHASGELVMILNNDTIVHPGGLDSLIDAIQIIVARRQPPNCVRQRIAYLRILRIDTVFAGPGNSHR